MIKLSSKLIDKTIEMNTLGYSCQAGSLNYIKLETAKPIYLEI